MLGLSIYDGAGQRKYLTGKERDSFLAASTRQDIGVQSFCWMLATTGCRISEGLALTAKSIDFEARHVVIECLKKRGKKVFRTVPLSPKMLDLLRKLIAVTPSAWDRLWPWSRMTGYRRVREVMHAARINGPHATPKGLRHAFGVSATQSNIPLNIIQRWLGHADIKTTAIYANAVGPEERAFASRTWKFGVSRLRSRPSPKAKQPKVARDKLGQEARQASFERPAAYASRSLLTLAILLNDRVSGVSNALYHAGGSM